MVNRRAEEDALIQNPASRPVTVWQFFREGRTWLILTAITGIIYNVGMIAAPLFEGQLAQYLYDILQGSRAAADIVALAVVYVLVIAAVQGARALKRLYVRKFANRVSRSMKERIFHHLVHEPTSELAREDTGAMMTRALADADACAEGMRKVTTEIFDTGVVMVAYLVTLLVLDWRMTLLAIIFPPIAYVVSAKLKVYVAETSAKSKQAMGELNGMTLDAMSNAVTYRAYGEDENRARAYEDTLSAYQRANVAAGVWQNSPQPIYLVISMISVVFIVYLGAKNVLGTGWSLWTIATFSSFLATFTRLATKSSHAAKLFNAVQKAQVSWRRVASYLTDDVPPATDAVALPAELSLEGVSCGGADGGFALHDITLRAEPGQIVGIAGRVASGKSMLGRLLLGEDPYDGRVIFGGRELTTVPEQVVSYAGHDPSLFNDTVRDNVTFGKADESRLRDVLEEVQLSGEVDPDMVIGSAGSELSGGQQARIAVARALYSRAPVVVLDDPFASVDAQTELTMFQAMRERETWRILIIISHRLTTFAQMDSVVYMQDGSAEQGSFERMCENPGFAELYALQASGAKPGSSRQPAEDLPPISADGEEPGAAGAHEGPVSAAARSRVVDIMGRDLHDHPARSLAALLVIVASLVLVVLPPLVLAQAVDNLTAGTAVSLALALEYFALLAGSGLADALREGLIVAVGESITHALRSAMMAKVCRLPTQYFTQHEAGKTTSVLVNDVDAVESMFTSGVVSLFSDLGTVVVTLVVIFTKSVGLGVMLLVVLPLLFLFTRRVQKKMLAAHMENRKATAQASGILPETMRIIRVLHVFRAEPYAEARYDKAVRKSFQAVERTNFYDAIYSPVVLTAAALVIGVMMSLSGQSGIVREWFGMSVGTAVALIAYVNAIFTPLASIGMEIQTIQSAAAGWKRTQAFLDEPERHRGEERRHDDASVAVRGTRGIPVCMREVTFGYVPDHLVLERFSIDVQPGEFVTLRGRTGAGKSTIFKLLLGLYEPLQGEVLLGDRHPAELAGAERRHVVACVEQRVSAVPGTIRDQITLGNPAFSDEQVWAALEVAGLTDAVRGLEGALDTPYAQVTLSQGQQQLLMIARAAVSDPQVLLLDEIASGLDRATERLVFAALEQASRGRTVLSISHRAALKERGRTVEIG